jgi:uncharacterized SAM-binding protein YcdF (DUF218 family)
VLADGGERGDAAPGEDAADGPMGGMDAREGLSAGGLEDAAGGICDRGAGGSDACAGERVGVVHLYSKGSSDRFDTALGAYRAGCAPIMVFGGGSSGVPGGPTKGEWNRSRAVERGVPEAAALAAGRALYTSDESQLVATLLRERGAKKPIVCMSAMHLPRAAGNYLRLGFTVTPLPADFSTRVAAEGWSWALLVPRGLALSQVDAVA